jgi:predicted permease
MSLMTIDLPMPATTFEILAALPHDFDVARILTLTIVAGLIAIGVCGGLLAGFIHSLHQEEDRGETQFSTRSAGWLVALIGSLLFFSVLFLFFAFRVD